MTPKNDPSSAQSLLDRFRANLGEALILTLAFYLLIALAFLIDVGVRNVDNTETPEMKFSYILVALAPFIALLMVSGELKEISAPGGISLSMRNEAQATISPVEESNISVEPSSVMEKGDIRTGDVHEEGVNKLAQRVQRIQPTSLSFQIGREDYYAEEAIEAYLSVNLKRNPSFRYILFTGRSGEFRGAIPIDHFVFIHQYRVNDLVEEIETGDVLQYPKVITNSVNRDVTNREVLQRMEQTDSDNLAVVDDDSEFVGIVTQDEIVRGALSGIFRNTQ